MFNYAKHNVLTLSHYELKCKQFWSGRKKQLVFATLEYKSCNRSNKTKSWKKCGRSESIFKNLSNNQLWQKQGPSKLLFMLVTQEAEYVIAANYPKKENLKTKLIRYSRLLYDHNYGIITVTSCYLSTRAKVTNVYQQVRLGAAHQMFTTLR